MDREIEAAEAYERERQAQDPAKPARGKHRLDWLKKPQVSGAGGMSSEELEERNRRALELMASHVAPATPGSLHLMHQQPQQHGHSGNFQIKQPKLKTASNELQSAADTERATGISAAMRARSAMIEVHLNDRLGKKVRVKCNETDTVGDLKKLAAAHLGTRPEKLRIQKWHAVYKDHISLRDYEVHDGMGLELYYM